MKAIIYVLVISVSVALLNGCGIVSKKYTKSESSEFNVFTGNKIKLKLENINGDVTVSKSTGLNSLRIIAYKETKVKKKYLDTPFDEIKIDIDTNSNSVIVKSVITNKGQDGFFNFGRSQKVDYIIYVPENIDVEIDNVNGKISAGNIGNNLDINIVNGNADLVGYFGKMKCNITNGSVSGELDSTGGLKISVINGSISLKLSSFLNANLKAETVNGKVTDEGLLLSEVVQSKKQLKAKLGTLVTETDIRLETINGKIKLTGFREI